LATSFTEAEVNSHRGTRTGNITLLVHFLLWSGNDFTCWVLQVNVRWGPFRKGLSLWKKMPYRWKIVLPDLKFLAKYPTGYFFFNLYLLSSNIETWSQISVCRKLFHWFISCFFNRLTKGTMVHLIIVFNVSVSVALTQIVFAKWIIN
jgi:hypothetical protein